MRRKLILAIAAAAALLGAGSVVATPAQAGPPVRAGYDQCGNFQIWVNGTPLINYLICNPDG